jgi:TP901 family phage tail tape measure protein
LKASAVGLGETKTIADLATSALNAYGKENLSATDATDVLTASVREGKLEASALSAAMGQVLPVASNMGVQFHEVGAAFAAMSRTGTNASEAATSLNAILAGLLKTTPDAEKALEDMSLSSEGLKQQIKDEGLLSVLTTLKNKFDQNKDAVQRVFPNVRALKGVLDLVGASAETNAEIFVSLSKSVGATDEAFGKTKDASFEFDVQIAKLQDKLLSIGTKLLPIINKGLDLFNKLLDIGTQDYAADLENAKVKLYQLAKAEEDARLVVQKHIEARGEGSKDLKTYQANLDRATLATKNQLNVVTSLRQKIDDLTTSQNTAADSVNNLSGSTTGSTTPLEDYKNALIDVKENGIDKLVNEGLKPLETSLLKTIPQGLDLTKLKAREMEEEFEDTDLQGILDNFDNGIENLAIGAAVNFAQMALEGKKSFRQITHEIAKMIQKQILALVITTALKAAFAGKGFLEILPKLAAGLAVFAGAGIIAGATAPGEGGMEVPQMAAGGLVTKPTLAMIGERGAEAVIPLNRLDGMMGGNREFTIRGQDLVLAMDRANGFKSRITG